MSSIPVPARVMEFAARNQMRIKQINAQRIYGPSLLFLEDWSPPKGSEIFVARIARRMTEIELVPLFEQSGQIFKLRLMMDFSGTNRGYCFVQYFHPGQADLAIQILHHYQIRPGHKIVATKSVDNCKLIFKGMPMYKTDEEILQELNYSSAGATQVSRIGGGVKGTVKVTYINHRSAALARSKVYSGGCRPWGYLIDADWAEPEINYPVEYQFRQGLRSCYQTYFPGHGWTTHRLAQIH